MTQAVKLYNANMRHAFTVIELLIVVAIIVIIACLATSLRADKPPAAPEPSATSSWTNEAAHTNRNVTTYIVTAPDRQQWIVFYTATGTAALPYTPRAIAKPVGPE